MLACVPACSQTSGGTSTAGPFPEVDVVTNLLPDNMLGDMRRIVLFLALIGACVAVDAPQVSAQWTDEPPLGLSPDSGGPTDTFTATYDISKGGCSPYDKGWMVHFYWFGGSSSITVMGKQPLIDCVASLTTTPPPGTPPGAYTVGADVFSPAGPQRSQSGEYRVGPKPRPSTKAPGDPEGGGSASEEGGATAAEPESERPAPASAATGGVVGAKEDSSEAGGGSGDSTETSKVAAPAPRPGAVAQQGRVKWLAGALAFAAVALMTVLLWANRRRITRGRTGAV